MDCVPPRNCRKSYFCCGTFPHRRFILSRNLTLEVEFPLDSPIHFLSQKKLLVQIFVSKIVLKMLFRPNGTWQFSDSCQHQLKDLLLSWLPSKILDIMNSAGGILTPSRKPFCGMDCLISNYAHHTVQLIIVL